MTIQQKAAIAAAALGLLGVSVAQAQTTPGTQPGSVNQMPSHGTPTTEPSQPVTQQPRVTPQPGQAGSTTQQAPSGSEDTTQGATQEGRSQRGQFATGPQERTSQQAGKLGEQETVELVDMNEEQVRSLQRKLESLGLYQGEVDGIMGPQTKKALRSYYQQQASLVGEGKLLAESVAAFDIDASEIQRVRGEDRAQKREQPRESSTRERGTRPAQREETSPQGATQGKGTLEQDTSGRGTPQQRGTGSEHEMPKKQQGTGSPTGTGTDTRGGMGESPDTYE